MARRPRGPVVAAVFVITACASDSPTDPPTASPDAGVDGAVPAALADPGAAASTSPTLDLLVTPTSLDFGDVAVGTTSAGQSVQVTNVSGEPIQMSGVGGAPAGDFSGSQTCQGQILQPGESCAMHFDFAPSDTGEATAVSAGAWNDQPFEVELRGHGTPRFRVTPTALDFGDVPVGSTSPVQAVTVTNVSGAPVQMEGVGGAPGGDFSGSQTCQGITLQPGESCAMHFDFSPSGTGETTAISAGAWNGQPFEVELRGSGVGPSFLITPLALDFGEVPVGSTSPVQAVTVTNVGGAPVQMEGVGGAPGGDFSGSQTCQGITLQPGESCAMHFDFSPSETGEVTAISAGAWSGVGFSIALRGIGIPPGTEPDATFLVSPTALDFGDVLIGSTSPVHAVTVRNVSGAPVQMEGVGGAPGGDFSGSQTCQGITLQPGESCAMHFDFSPSEAGEATAISAGAWSGQPFEVELRGRGVGPSFLVTPLALDFGGVRVGDISPTQSVTVTNVGGTPIPMEGVGGAPGGDFSGSQTCQGITLQPGESCSMQFEFSPSETGEATAISAGAWSGMGFSIELRGVGLRRFLITPIGLDFGEVTVGTTSPAQTVGITNVGSTSVEMSGVGGAPGAPFGGAQGCQGISLGAGESCTMHFTYSPTEPGLASAASTGAWNDQSFEIGMEGVGIAPFRIASFDPPLGSLPSLVAGMTTPIRFAIHDAAGEPMDDEDAAAAAEGCEVTVALIGVSAPSVCATYQAGPARFAARLPIPRDLPDGTYFIEARFERGGLTLASGTFEVEVREP
jgi:hypothetical protein